MYAMKQLFCKLGRKHCLMLIIAHCLIFLTVVPHITDAIQEWVERVASIPVARDEHRPDVCVIEVC